MQNPYLSIWTKPKETFRLFFKERPSKSVYKLPFVVLGISLALNVGQDIFQVLGADSSLTTKILVYLFLTPFTIGLVFLFMGLIQPWMIKIVGNIWNGEASRKEIANVNALSYIPACLIVIYQLTLLIIGQEPSTDNINILFHYAIWILTFSFFIIGLSIVQKFSYGIALLNFFISILPFIILRLMLSY
ncbi:hypothetical protein QYS49_35320 [Marivirga salinae]|uniref:Yip1 domain-containing protein n=1 Tax=Marivirga salinarum TaxID=3059078 RepID=A0AA51NDJ8_9BACT|nr:hypothetical protein [Marivirga sp. BDSF4-3]WMN13014.1 hypothetical protein QYS49_35320 [Marivirga sp. BDSF4-3]